MVNDQEKFTDVSLNQLMGAFNHNIAELQQLMVIRGVNVSKYTADLSSLDVTVGALEQQLHKIKSRVKSEAETLCNARKFIEVSSHQQKKLERIVTFLPSQFPGGEIQSDYLSISSTPAGKENSNRASSDANVTPATKEKKGKGPIPRCYVSANEFASLSSYMRGRLSLEKVNAAIDEMASFAEANARLLATQRRKIADDMVDKLLELREIAYIDAMKGKHFFLEQDMRGQILKLDNTGKAILTVLRHLGRTSEARVGRQRVFAIMRV